MRRLIPLLTVLFCLTALQAYAVYTPGVNYSQGNTIIMKNQVIVRFNDGVALDAVTKGFGMVNLGVSSVDRILNDYKVQDAAPVFRTDAGKSNEFSRFYRIRVPQGVDSDGLLASLKANPNVADAYYDKMCRVAATPNDPAYGSQWHLYDASGRNDTHAREGWDKETGSDSVIIGIIDTGVNYAHPDLANNIWINPAEDIDGNMVVMDSTDIDHIDQDGNGYTDDLIGFDFFTGGGTPAWPGEDGSIRDNDPNDFNGHGTHVSGIAAAVTNDAIGGAGISGGWGKDLAGRGAQIMCLRAGYSADDGGVEAGYLVMSCVAEAITYAARNGAKVINYSAGSSFTADIYAAVLLARDSADILFCTAAGNDNSSIPASYFDTQAGMITVAATENNDTKWTDPWGGSNYGTWVEVSAPGHNIYSTVSNHYTPGYAVFTGTSMASPCVAGMAALLKSHYPNFTRAQLYALIVNTTDDIDALNPGYAGMLGSGRINIETALSTAPVANFSGAPRFGPPPLTVDFTDLSPAATSWVWTFGDGDVTGGAADVQHEYTDPGLYTVSLEIDDSHGTDTETKKGYIFVTADTLYGGAMIPKSISTPVPIYLKHTLPAVDTLMIALTYPRLVPALTLDSISLAGTDGASFDDVSIVAQTLPSSNPQKIAIRMIPNATSASDPLAAGDHHLFDMYFTATSNGTATIDTTTINGKSFKVYNRFINYTPVVADMQISVGTRGDANGDGSANVGDAVYIINFVFKGGPPPVSTYAGDANADGTVNVGDSVYLINWIFKSGPPPPP